VGEALCIHNKGGRATFFARAIPACALGRLGAKPMNTMLTPVHAISTPMNAISTPIHAICGQDFG
jgi:hypothetical protein